MAVRFSDGTMNTAFRRGKLLVDMKVAEGQFRLDGVPAMVGQLANEIELNYGRLPGEDKQSLVAALATEAIHLLADQLPDKELAEATKRALSEDFLCSLIDVIVSVSKGQVFEQHGRACCTIL